MATALPSAGITVASASPSSMGMQVLLISPIFNPPLPARNVDTLNPSQSWPHHSFTSNFAEPLFSSGSLGGSWARVYKEANALTELAFEAKQGR